MKIQASKFPALPEFSARFQPIYFEPIVGSGERFTIGILAQTENGEGNVLQTISDKTMQCMYGNMAQQIMGLVALVLESAKAHLKSQSMLELWQPPISGVTRGDIQNTYSNKGIDGVLFQAIAAYSSLYKGKITTDALNELNGNDTLIDEAEQSSVHLLQTVKACINDPVFSKNWQREAFINGSHVRIDYLGVNYNANLVNFDVKTVKNAFKAAKVKLFDLEVLRGNRRNDVFDLSQSFELLIALRNNAPSEAEDHYQMIERLADSIELRVIKKPTPQELATRIMEQEAA